MRFKCDDCEKVTEHDFAGIVSGDCQLYECENCHHRMWVKAAKGTH